MDKVRKYVIKEKGEQIFFLVCFILLVVIDSIDNTSLRYSELSWMETMYVLRNALYFLMLAGVGWNFLRRLLILRKQHQLTASRLGEFVGVALLILLGGASFLGSRDSTLLCFFVIAVGVNGLSSRRLARLYFVLKSIALVSTILCWRIGLLPTLRYLDDTVGHYNTYGFGHRNVLGANLVVLCLLWCYLRYQKLKVQDLIIWAAIAFVSYRFILSRTALIMILISVIFMYGMQRLEKRIFNFPHLGRLVTGIFIGFILLSLISAIFYSPDSEFWQFLNRIFTKRISFAHQYLVDHGLSLFGKDLPFVSSMEAQVSDSRRLILDNSFLRVILYYGILPGAAFFYLYYRGIRYALSRKKGALLCTLVVFLIFGMSESYMLDAFYQFPLILVCCSPKFWEGWNRPLFPILKAKPAIQAQSKGQDSIKKNFAYNVTYQLLLIVLPVITTPYIARIFGADGIGTYAYTYTVANFFVLFTMLGVKNYGNRSVAAVRNDKTRLGRVFWEIYGLQLICSVISLVFYLLYVLFLAGEYQQIAFIQGLYVLSSLLDISWLFFGLEKFRITVTRNIVIRLISLACIFIFVSKPSDLWKYTLILALGTLLSQAYLWRYLPQFVRWWRPKPRDVFRHLPGELILFVPIIAISIYKMMDKIMLEMMSGVTQVGFYENAEKIVNIPLGIITALGTVMLPRMAHLVAQGKQEQSNKYISSSMKFAMFLAIAMMFGMIGVAPVLIPVFLGKNFESCIPLLQLMAITVPFIAWANVIRTQYLIPNQRDHSYIISVLLGAATNVVVNLILIPPLAAKGAVIGSLCAEAIVCLSQTWMVRGNLEIKTYIRGALPFLLIGSAMMLAVLGVSAILPRNVWGLIGEVAIGAFVYLVLSLGWLAYSEPRLLKRISTEIRGIHKLKKHIT